MMLRGLVLCCLCLLSVLTAPLTLAGTGPAGKVVSMQSASLPERPLRIVSLEDITTEILLALDIVPVGVGGLDAYQQQDKPLANRLDGSVDLGTSQQPNLERLVRLQPDLVIGTSILHSGLFGRLDSLSPTVLYEVSLEPFSGDAVDRVEGIVRHLAGLTGRKQRADRVMASLDDAIARGRQAARESGVAGQPLAVLYPLPSQGLFIVSNNNALMVSLANRLGGTSPWPVSDGRTLHKRIEIHELAKIPDLHLMFIGGFKGHAMFESPLWQALPVAQHQDYGFLPTIYWSFGGPLTAKRIMVQMTGLVATLGAGAADK